MARKTEISNAYAPKEAPTWRPEEVKLLNSVHRENRQPPVDVRGSAWGFDPWEKIAHAAAQIARAQQMGGAHAGSRPGSRDPTDGV